MRALPPMPVLNSRNRYDFLVPVVIGIDGVSWRRYLTALISLRTLKINSETFVGRAFPRDLEMRLESYSTVGYSISRNISAKRKNITRFVRKNMSLGVVGIFHRRDSRHS